MRSDLLLLSGVITAFCFASNIQGQDLLNKPYAIQCRAVDSIYDVLNNVDSAAALALYAELEARYKSDEQLVYLLKIGSGWWKQRHGKRNKNFEQDLLDLSELFAKRGFDKLRAEVMWILAEYYWHNKKDLSRSLEHSIYAYDISAKYPFDEFPHKGEITYWLGSRYYYFRDFETAKKFFLEYWNEISYESTTDRASKLNTLGLCYQHLEKYDSAGYYFKRTIETAKESGDDDWQDLGSGNLAYIYFLEKKYDQSIALFEGDTFINAKQTIDEADALSIIGAMYYLKGDKKKALKLATEAYDILKSNNHKLDYYDIKVIYPPLARVFAGTGNTGLAYALLDTVTTADDSVFKSRNAVLMAGVQHKTEAAKHMAQIQLKEEEVRMQKRLRNSFIIGFSIVLGLSVLALYQKRRIAKEKAKSEGLLLNILPAETAEELKAKGRADAKYFNEVTVMFTDFKGFTQIAEKLSPAELVNEIHECFQAFDTIITHNGIEKIKTIGDAYMCAGGLPEVNPTHPGDVVRAALEIIDYMEEHKQDKIKLQEPYFEIRIGIHTGPVVAGIVGKKKFAYDIWGDTVNIASRMESGGEAGKVNISGSTYESVKDKFNCEYRGEIEAKGKGKIKMYFVDA
jgi:class 3 adenylate cyclase